MSKSNGNANRGGWRLLWLWVCLGFALLIGAWVTLFTIVSKHSPEPIPLTKMGQPEGLPVDDRAPSRGDPSP